RPVTLRIHDLCGFDARVDAILFHREATPPESVFRRPESPVIPVEKKYDLVVVGGGIAGTCAAVSAARLGCDVALVQDRPVLGGNGSSEIRVHLNGNINQPPYPNLGNLTYLMGPHGGGNARESTHYRDETRLKLVQAESRIDLFLNTRVVDVEMVDVSGEENASGEGKISDENGVSDKEGTSNTSEERDGKTGGKRIAAVVGQDVITGERRGIAGRLFADCTGDGCVGFLAGADWRMGRESVSETGEGEAPEVADRMTMGSSVQWYTEDVGTPQSFPELPWAVQFTPESIRPMLRGDWDWENGLHEDQILDFEKIRDRGLRAAYGHWSYMKNRMDGEWAEKVRNRRLGWVAYIAGKRESRRLLGDVILRQQDIQGGHTWPDASVTTTWSIDLHYPAEENTKFFPGEEFRARAHQMEIRPYAIPYRCFYSRNVANLFMAGRDISVTHVALGTVRVMRTGGMMGEVVGMAASICRTHDCDPRAVYTDHLEELKRLMREGVAPAPPEREAAAKSLELPDWMRDAGRNLASLPGTCVTASGEHESGLYPATFAIDGRADVTDNRSRWVSDTGADPHWIQLTWREPIELNTLRVITGQVGGADGEPKTPIRDSVLQYRESDDATWVEIPETRVSENQTVAILSRFPTVRARSVRLWIP
ncbi:MAG: FAD-dependent oxidoreductase, partial [Planctomycetia bacterium]|nr:FAD-dependent oxidoreductase [Planctomycetia bacterium]